MPTQKHHYQIIDILRGCAILLMFIYHISFDLNDAKIFTFHFYTDPFWLYFRIFIVSSFLLLMGISLAIACSKQLNKKRYSRRLALLFVYALLVSIFSYLMFPNSMIFFGILHFIFVASLLALLFSSFYRVNLFLGLVCLSAGNYFKFTFFDQSYLQWVGLMTKKPVTEDYVPLIPWFGVVLIGMFVGKLVFVKRKLSISNAIMAWSSNNSLLRLIEFGGKHSLHIYILHQPIFIGLIYVLTLLVK